MSVRHNAFQLAEDNRTFLKAQFDAVCQRLTDAGHMASLDAFLYHLSSWTVSMNMWSDDLESFIDFGHRNIVHKTMDDLASANDLGIDNSMLPVLDEAMERMDPAWYPKRNAYRSVIEGEEEFKYGALFVQGEALAKYGPYQVELRRDAVSNYLKLFVLKEDSLAYVDASPQLDIQKFKLDISCRDNAHELAVVKHEADLAQGFMQAKTNLCFAISDAERSYLEVQIEDPVIWDDVSALAVTKKYHQELQQIVVDKVSRHFHMDKAEDREKSGKWLAYKRIKGKISKFGMKIETPT